MALQDSNHIRFNSQPTRFQLETVSEFTITEAEKRGQNLATKVDFQNVQHILDHLGESVEEFEQRRQSMIGELQTVAVEVAVAVASKLVFHELKDAESIALPLVKQLVENLDQRFQCKVWLNPDDLVIIENSQQMNREISTAASDGATDSTGKTQSQTDNILFLGDPKLARGDCKIDNGSESLISSIQSKLSEIRHQLIESLQDAEIERRRSENANRGIRRFPNRRAVG
jgi:flagellar biosynthesis/type III secretory pathway protein FliH